MRTLKIICMVLVVSLFSYESVYASAEDQQDEDQAAVSATPPRLSYVDGQVSFWRSGAEDWAQAQVNIPLAPGDQLYSGSPGNLELQIDARAFIRAGENTQIGLENLEDDLIQVKVTEGHVSLDIHQNSDSSRTVEIDTPNAAFLIEDPGYYKVQVSGDNTTFSVYWSGRASVTPAEGEAFIVSSDREVRLRGLTRSEISTFRAPELDEWDQWCLSRSDENINSASSRYISRDIYGANDLDKAGVWQETPDYGPVWTPTNTPEDWAPYTNGSWANHPVYGWSWVDNERWGWAPYHYGRWISLNGRWVWAPGPPVRKPAYAPALVVFFGGQDNMVGGPVVGWVPLSWGEPLIPWWGPKRSHRPWWGGWGGPRLGHVERTGDYRNMSVGNAMVVVHENRFGRVPIGSARVSDINPRVLRPLPAAPIISSTHSGFMSIEKKGVRPPDAVVERRVVSTRPLRRPMESVSPGQQLLSPTGRDLPAPRIVNAPKPETLQKRIEVRHTLPNEQPSQVPSRQLQGEPVTSPPERHESKMQQQQQEIQQQQIQQQQLKEQQARQQQMQEQQMHQQQIREQQVKQQQIEQQLREQQAHQQQMQEQQRHQQLREQQVRQQQIQQQQIQQQHIQQQQQVQQQQQIKKPGPKTPEKKGEEAQGEERNKIIRTQ